MAIHAQSSCTLSTITDVEAVYTYYYLSDSTITVNEAPKDDVNPPGASTITVISEEHSYVWQITEPQLNIQDDVIQTAVGQLYYIECVEFSDGTYDWGPLMTSSTYAAAKAAYNLSSQALTQAQAANNATALLGGHFLYNSTWQTTNTPHSANIVQTIEKNGIDVSNDPTKWDYNVHIGANGIRLRNNESVLSEWTSTALKFNDPSTGNAQLTIGSSGALQSGNFSIANNTNTFSTLGTKIDLTYGEIYTPYFRVSQGSISGTAAGVYITGNFESTNAKIGGTKQWDIKTFIDANTISFASMIGPNKSFIQLGGNNTWLLDTNKIHTAWYISGNYLAYPQFDNNGDKYYDFGLNLPNTLTDKFLYIRYNSSSDLSTIYQNDSGWAYPFYIDASGNIVTTGSIDAHNISIDGQSIAGGSLIAGSLAAYGGAYNQPVYFPSTGDNQGKPVGITDGNGNAITIGVSVPANAKFTDTKNTAGATSSTSKLFLIGATEQTDNPQTYSRSTVYIGTDGLLYSGSKKVAVVDDISAVLKYKGTKATIANLPSSGNTTGDVWHVTANNGEYAWDGTEWQELGSTITIPANTGNSTTGITIADHSTTTIYGVQSTTTTASKVTLGTAFTIPNVTGASDVTVPKAASSATACDDITDWQPGSGSANLTFTMDSTDTKKLKITFNHAHTAPTLSYTARSITGVSGSTTASKVTLGTEFTVPNVTDSSNVTVPIKNASNTTVVTNGAHSITDNGHIHTI